MLGNSLFHGPDRSMFGGIALWAAMGVAVVQTVRNGRASANRFWLSLLAFGLINVAATTYGRICWPE